MFQLFLTAISSAFAVLGMVVKFQSSDFLVLFFFKDAFWSMSADVWVEIWYNVSCYWGGGQQHLLLSKHTF